MNQRTVLRAADRRPQPWKNGGGVTSEVIAHPSGSGMEAFEWRASIAQVAVEGPFSCFPGVDRVLVVLDGELELSVDNAPPMRLDNASPPLPFPADVPAYGRPAAGTVTDFNFMYRRERWAVDMLRSPMSRSASLGHGGVGAAIVLATEPMKIRHARSEISLERLDAIFVPNIEDLEIGAFLHSAPIIVRIAQLPGTP